MATLNRHARRCTHACPTTLGLPAGSLALDAHCPRPRVAVRHGQGQGRRPQTAQGAQKPLQEGVDHTPPSLARSCARAPRRSRATRSDHSFSRARALLHPCPPCRCAVSRSQRPSRRAACDRVGMRATTVHARLAEGGGDPRVRRARPVDDEAVTSVRLRPMRRPYMAVRLGWTAPCVRVADRVRAAFAWHGSAPFVRLWYTCRSYPQQSGISCVVHALRRVGPCVPRSQWALYIVKWAAKILKLQN